MLSLNQFTTKWQRLHHPSMDVSGDVDFFYQLYCELHRLVKEEEEPIDESVIRSLLLYTENEIAIGFDGVYEYRYRSLGDVVGHFCDRLHMTADAVSQVHRLLSKAVAQASDSSLRRWMIESVLSHDFQHLSGMLTWFVRADVCLRRVYPDLRFRKAMFRKITGERLIARRMRFADLAFNWQDKRGYSLAAIIAERCRSLSTFPLTDKTEQLLLSEVADALETIHSERLDTYTVIERKDNHTFTLWHRNGRVFENVVLNEELRMKNEELRLFHCDKNKRGFERKLMKNEESDYLAAQLVTYLGKTYINGPAVWLDSKDVEKWNGERIWADIINKEQDAARQRNFTTTFGRRISLYDDLYTVPEDPDEAHDADWGIYWDEPNVFDFLNLFGQLKREIKSNAETRSYFLRS